MIGLGVKQDYNKGKEFYVLAISPNYQRKYISVNSSIFTTLQMNDELGQICKSLAFVDLGDLYFKGLGVKQDSSRAIQYYKLAAENNNSDAIWRLGLFYLKGEGTKQDFKKAKEYFELSARFNNEEALLHLGEIYLYGIGTKQDYEKSKKYFELSLQRDNSEALYYLGIIYEGGFGVVKDYLRAKKYYEFAIASGNNEAYVKLGNLYFYGRGVKQDYKKAKEYYELSAKQGNSTSFIKLGYMHSCGLGLQKDYIKAKRYFEISAMLGEKVAYYNLGIIYFHGFGVGKDIAKAKEYIEISAKYNCTMAQYFLGVCYFDGDAFDVDIPRAIDFFQMCKKNHFGNHVSYNQKSRKIEISTYNEFYYHACNGLGLIYIIVYQDKENAIANIKEAGLNEFPFGQNNLGLLYEFYFDQKYNAEHMYKRSMEHCFALSAFNLGHMKEEESIQDSIDFYIKASDYEDEPLVFHGKKSSDKRLEISKKFVICYTNLKLSEYYYAKSDIEKSRKYFIKSFSKFDNTKNSPMYKFHFTYKLNNKTTKNAFSYLKSFILNFPAFNLSKQPHLSQQNKELLSKLQLIKEDSFEEFGEEKTIRIQNERREKEKENNFHFKSEMMKNQSKDNLNYIDKNNYEHNYIEKVGITQFYQDKSRDVNEEMKNYKIFENEKKISFENPDELFDFVIKDDELTKELFEEIREIMHIMKDILYTPPYSILFGRINIEKPKVEEVKYKFMKDINEIFYEGFGIDI